MFLPASTFFLYFTIFSVFTFRRLRSNYKLVLHVFLPYETENKRKMKKGPAQKISQIPVLLYFFFLNR